MITTLIAKAVFNQEELILGFIEGIETTLKKLNVKENFTNNIIENENDIVVCILALLHNARFRLFDNTIASCFISTYLNSNDTVFENCTLQLTFKIPIVQGDAHCNLMFPLLTSNAKAIIYIDKLIYGPHEEFKRNKYKKNK